MGGPTRRAGMRTFGRGAKGFGRGGNMTHQFAQLLPDSQEMIDPRRDCKQHRYPNGTVGMVCTPGRGDVTERTTDIAGAYFNVDNPNGKYTAARPSYLR